MKALYAAMKKLALIGFFLMSLLNTANAGIVEHPHPPVQKTAICAGLCIGTVLGITARVMIGPAGKQVSTVVLRKAVVTEAGITATATWSNGPMAAAAARAMIGLSGPRLLAAQKAAAAYFVKTPKAL